LHGRIKELGYVLEIDKAATAYIADKGYDSKFGARPLARAIQRYVEDPLAEEIINSKLHEGDTIKITLDKKADELKIEIIAGEASAKTEK
jgi:ATP-dependent Clp protease ATP-binding subunit ClpC